MKLKNFEIQVHVEGSPLVEHEVRYNNEQVVAGCFIASETGKAFELTLQNDGGPGTMYVCAVYIDGTLIDKYLVTPDVDKVVEGIRVEEGKVRPFVFSNVRLTDDEDVAAPDSAPPKQLGTLRCEVFRVARLGRFTGWHEYNTPNAIKEDPVLHERTKMAGAHRVQLGQLQTKEKEIRTKIKYIDPSSGIPYITFTFRYQPKAMLQAQGIVPIEKFVPKSACRKRHRAEDGGPTKRARTDDGRSYGVGSEPGKDDVKSEGVDDDLVALLAQRDALDARIQAASQPVKRESSPIALRPGRHEVIDLTGD